MVVGLLALVTLGGAVRVTDSGLACPDWPLCYNRLLPTSGYEGQFQAYQVWFEWTHRLVASLVGFVIIAWVVGAWRVYRDRRWVVLPALLAVVALAVQVVLGGLTVTEDLPAGIVTAHLSMALLIIVLLVASWLATFVRPAAEAGRPPQARSATHARLLTFVAAAALGTLALLVVGGYVSGSQAAYFCNNEWPRCNGTFVPGGQYAGLHMAHRWLAVIAGLIVLGAWAAVARRRADAPGAFRLLTVVLALFAVQVILGAANMWTDLADSTRIAHLGVGGVLWAVLVAALSLLAHQSGIIASTLESRRALPGLFPAGWNAPTVLPGKQSEAR